MPGGNDWSRDEKTLLMYGGNPYQVNVLDLASHQQTPLLKHPRHHLLRARFSPDNRWVSFMIRTEPSADSSRWRRRGTQAGSRKRLDYDHTVRDSRLGQLVAGREDAILYFQQRWALLSVGAAAGSSVPPADGRGLRGAASSRARVLSARGWVGGGRPNRVGARRGYRQHLDDVTLWRALSSRRRPPRR